MKIPIAVILLLMLISVGSVYFLLETENRQARVGSVSSNDGRISTGGGTSNVMEGKRGCDVGGPYTAENACQKLFERCGERLAFATVEECLTSQQGLMDCLYECVVNECDCGDMGSCYLQGSGIFNKYCTDRTYTNGEMLDKCNRFCEAMQTCDDSGEWTDGQKNSCKKGCEESFEENSWSDEDLKVILCVDNADCESFFLCMTPALMQME